MKRTKCDIIRGMKSKDIVGYEGVYKIFEDGKVWSYRRKRFIKTPKDKDGYRRATLCLDRKVKNMTMHRWLYQTFVGEIPKTHQINHKDGNKLNNKLENLELVTPKENTIHAWKHGLSNKQLGIKCSASKLKDKDIRKIRELYSQGTSQNKIAEILNVHQTNIHYILIGKTWSHVT